MTKAATIVRHFYDALARGDVAAILSLLDENIAWTEAEGFPYYKGTWHGPQAVLENLLKPLARDWDEFSAKPHEFIAQGNRIVSLGTYSGKFKRTGRSFSAPFAHVWTVQGDKLTRFDMHTDTAKVLEVLESEPTWSSTGDTADFLTRYMKQLGPADHARRAAC